MRSMGSVDLIHSDPPDLGKNISRWILKMLFLKLSNADVLFGEKTLTWKSYTTNEALSTTKQV